MVNVTGEQWESDGLYPFTDDSTLNARRSGFSIPVGAIVDALIASTGSVHVSRVTRNSSGMSMTFSDSNGVITNAELDNQSSGWVWCDDGVSKVKVDAVSLAVSLIHPIGTYNFKSTAAVLVPWATYYAPVNGLSGIRIPTGEVFTGDIHIVAGSGMSIDADGTLHAVGDPYAKSVGDTLLLRPIRVVEMSDGVTTVSRTPSAGILPLSANISGSTSGALNIMQSGSGRVLIEVTG